MKLNNHFSIVIPSYNCEEWVEKNLESVLGQTYDNYKIYYIDDCSTDKTTNLVSSYKSDKIVTFFNSFNKGKMENLEIVNQSLPEDTITVILDGDDWFYDKEVLGFLNEVYQDPDVWMTNGSYLIEPQGSVVKPNLSNSYWSGNIRQKSWEFSHLGTFKKKLYDRIKKKHLMNSSGVYWATTSDQAIMWPMAEMAGPEHHRPISEVLYCYNRTNPLSDDRVHRTDQLLTEKLIRQIKPYDRLEKL
jgi:glycosyltransferase involved in cell wall biosynthesis